MFQPPNYTQIPNEFIDHWLPKLTLMETKVLLVIMRKTFGWHKTRDRISLSQLEKLTGSLRQAILKATKGLERAGLIFKEVVGKSGTQQTYYELVLIEDSKNTYQCDNNSNPSVIPTHTKETLTKENISPIVPKDGDPISSKRKKAKEEKSEMAPRVFLTPSQRNDLLRRLDSNIEKAVACYEKLSTWKISKGISGGNDFMQIVRWVIKAVEDEASKPKPIDRTKADEEFATKVNRLYPHNSNITLGHNYLEFTTGMTCTHLKFGENAFEEQARNCLRKMGLSI